MGYNIMSDHECNFFTDLSAFPDESRRFLHPYERNIDPAIRDVDCFKKSSWAVGQLVSGYPRGEVNWNWTFPAPKVQLTVAQLDLWQLDLNKKNAVIYEMLCHLLL